MSCSVTIRECVPEDWESVRGLLATLTECPPMSAEEVGEIFKIRSASNIVTVVAVSSDAIVGTASLVVEQKLIRGGKCVGHIEDVVTSPSHQGKGVGRALIEHLVTLSSEKNCYKIILDCDDKNIGFYKKFGFNVCENHMRKNL
ncbi:glucosamine-phosphate N-acetyltransferase [Angomonas deanei]|uniref:Glucosamine 6-phosphate N-acetyltransferase n=1 Tax=Angomonas deanei TaxID=59799 RepID=S9WRE0_9TRYP|nr:glucosamine-phosphate N-acetyltransferase [Angomonas deanei]EPY39522.1 glucosamine-phosphate N-acetyltransferase [Angomonas deanei]EPY43416.1 glucosamine-phosphate N-acetyltransferase [Angomonas deanei]CAD2218696.1 Acetyltransferase (GNAT) domain/Acetyltransferase (GNAT) family, putative [Angomonas deanei]|eukprot:EPY38520.1 glucosamine-phosphate N-acetyltransferase [Angomonas deanei]